MKKCFKCNVEKDFSCFYKHPQMGDGYLNKCKDCTKMDTKARYKFKLASDASFKQNEQIRGRDKYRRLYAGTGKANLKANKNWIDKYPEKRKANITASKLPLQEGMERNHWSYLKQHRLDIIPLTTKDHGKAHRFIIYDQERMMYRRCDTGYLLDTKERHIKFITHCIRNKPD